ncbi:hypothetical protein MATR_03850 [Marivirga tractuosa]|uniref:Uncharacterized protein n=1 Tax=Marivirga tractuosa (strain ATCC 23168 / DSM 4126 / NBRC 15989 / NCIMB 1408 / VKM B-1430 / H-43) TaxID=643867 RepID=E4TTS5_MARTH|nr:hypothetical protein [Marivirga tractuosa]ADR21980.1 hypothetical protein Ftrac_1995 [Marivirga tractuosa DSM 4126]BDD13560.1 hypothetical protein MATR_03850 [Marivirga tractuosa]
MKRKNNIQSVKRSGSLIFGLAMAVLLFFQQPYVTDISDKVEKTEQSEKEKPQAEYRMLAYDVLLPVMQFNLFHSFDLLLEIPNLNTEDFTILESVEKAYHNYFHTLFRLIISPNAP